MSKATLLPALRWGSPAGGVRCQRASPVGRPAEKGEQGASWAARALQGITSRPTTCFCHGQRDRDRVQGWEEDQDGKEQPGGRHACRVRLRRCSQTRQGMCMDRMEVTLKAFVTQAFGWGLGPDGQCPGEGGSGGGGPGHRQGPGPASAAPRLLACSPAGPAFQIQVMLTCEGL